MDTNFSERFVQLCSPSAHVSLPVCQEPPARLHTFRAPAS